MDQELVKKVAAAVKASGREPEPAIAQLFAVHDPDTVVDALKYLSQDIQAQLSDRLADWAEYKAETQERSEFLREQADYLSWKADAARYREGINAALRAAKSLRHDLNEAVLGRPARGSDKAAERGYVKGARVWHDQGGGDAGTVIEVQGRSVWVTWDNAPDLPVQYASPWHFSVIELLEEEQRD
jgi:hypothetical protein